MKQTLHLFLALFALLFVGCGYDDSAIIDRIKNLEKNQNTKIATINEQIEAINNSIASLEAAKADLDQRIKDAQADADANAEDIAELQEAKVILEERITTLQSYVDNELNNANEWASATFATLEQYNALAEDVAQLKGVIDGPDEVLKNWVNEQLAGYYTIAEVDAMLEALQKSVDENNETLQEDIEELSTKVDNMKAELTDAYTKAIEEAINTNNGVIDGKIAEAIAAVNGRIDSEVAAISTRIDALEERIEDLEDALDKIKALDIVFDIESGKACMAGASIEFGYTIVCGDEDSEVESFGDRGWAADVIATDATSGCIRVTAPKDGGNGKVVVLATSGAGASTMKSIRFEEGILTDIADRYEVDWWAYTLEVRLKTNVDYEVRIPAGAQSWLSVADTRATVREDTLTFSVAENPEGSPERTAVVELVNNCGEVLQSFEIVQKIQLSSDPIQFADEYVKKVCVEMFDTNGDGELSYSEASRVTSIGESFFGDYAIEVKTFDELQYFVNLTTIGRLGTVYYGAFSGCSSLTSITIPEGVTSIGDGTFYGCSSLTSITIPESVTSIGYDAFSDCSSLTSITIPEGVVSIENFAFSGCSSLTSITIPEGVVSIGGNAFAGCSSLTNITIPEGVTSIGYRAFAGCSSLTSITIPEGVVSIENYTFSDCSSLTSMTIPESVTAIGSGVFSDCSSLTSITIPEGVMSIGERAFEGCSSLTSITIPEGVMSIGGRAFSGCSSLTSMTIPEGVISIGQWAFSDCSSLTNITILEGVMSIGANAFSGCSNLTSITISEGVVSIENYAFAGCSSLTSMTIPESVTSIGYGVFSYCSSLENVYCKAIMPPVANRIGYYWSTFDDNASGRKIYVPMESVEAYTTADGWADYADSIVGYDFDNGVVVE
ncbi:MAG: leucine-rich repeat protein [Alistipes sp.]|nr:leucine-rich repeat protein [Alistipes sp.]